MTIVRWQPTAPTRSARELQSFNRMFGSFFDTPTAQRRWVPAVDFVEEGDSYVLRVDLPGVGRDDVKVELRERVLTVSGERRTESGEQKDGYYRLERSSGSFRRALRLPEGVDGASITAAYDEGVLTVRIPKPAEPQATRVEIAVGGAESAPAAEGEPAAA
jgi:HSP20 family protein